MSPGRSSGEFLFREGRELNPPRTNVGGLVIPLNNVASVILPCSF